MSNLDQMKEFWAGKTVLVTGHTGFKGSWLSLWLQRLGAKVVGYALDPPTVPSLFESARVDAGMACVRADVRDLETLTQTMRAHRPRVVIHMAAQSLVRLSYRSPVETYATNVLGTVHVLEAVRQAGGVRGVVNVTSDKCYENEDLVRSCRECDPMGGYDPYSSSKGCAELVTAAYRRSFFAEGIETAVASARAGNVIGGGDWAADRLVPDCVRAILDQKPVVVRNPRAARPWQHVLEPLGCYLLLAQKLCTEGPAYAEGWNFGPDEKDALPVSEIATRLTNLWGEGARWILDGGVHPHEAAYLRLDCSKAKQRLGWSPRLNVGRALEWVVDWHKRQRNGEDVRQLCLEQILDYSNMENRPNG